MPTISFPQMRALALDPVQERIDFFLSAVHELGFGAVMQARNTEEARDQVFFNPAQFIVMGAELKPWPAERFVAAVLEEARTPPAIIVVGNGQIENRRALIEAGASVVLSAPLSRQKLLNAFIAAASKIHMNCAPQAAHRRALRQGLI
ncbi:MULTISPECIES: hypothetical protein [Euryhalocaulis]|uniref:hypothetical protein n=1 Tax=Euryhalocaulis TaxID=1712422 RepID=UPI0003A4030A|nr:MULTISPECIES: hypothetical protein [Euryhalocaulis]MBA4801162.1 hypothetical protein [Euryhalocaulis sp.]